MVLALGLGAMGFRCEAATFTCYEGQGAANPAGCYCTVTYDPCADMGDCMMGCPVQ